MLKEIDMTFTQVSTYVCLFSLSSRHRKRVLKAWTLIEQLAYLRLTGDAWATIIQDKVYFRIEVERIMAYRCSRFNL